MTFTQALVLMTIVVPAFTAAGEYPFLVTDTDGRALAEAVVVLPARAESADSNARMVQKNRAFVPHVLAVTTGTEVAFPNRDNTQHHVYSFSPAKTFEIELYAGEPESPVRFGASGVVELGCNIHDHMQGFIVVSDQEHGVTGANGTVTLAWPGDRSFPDAVRVWHPRLPDNTRLHDVVVSPPEPGKPVAIALEVSPETRPDPSLQRLQQRFREL